ncbi:hypothetical protein F5Y16DRAFT_393503 [Xylariaceae sp. FL0255]|nr:hypothetical protein F5Y16DRAFT_393503 [Xylariaceae sp. FL0255]
MLIIEHLPSATEVIHDAPEILIQHFAEDEDMTMPTLWKGKGKEVAREDDSMEIALPELPAEQPPADWTKYEPPEGLRFAGEFDPEMVLRIILESIDKVKARIAQEEEARLAAAEAVRKRREEAQALKDQLVSALDPDAPVVGSDYTAETASESSRPSTAIKDGTTQFGAKQGGGLILFPVDLPARPKKRGFLNIFRKWQHSDEKGETISGGARRRYYLDASNKDLATYGARKRFVLDLLKKAAGEESSNSPVSYVHEPEVECVSCLDDFNPKEIVRGPCHSYCKPCFNRLITSACQHEQHWPPKCCLNNIDENIIVANLTDNELLTTYHARAVEWNIPIADRIYCSEPTCSLFVPTDNISRVQGAAQCTAGHLTCIHCRNTQHIDSDCPRDPVQAQTNQLAEDEGWQRCYSCHIYVEHSDACQHMTCRCGAEFCYVCGLRWRTCHCTMNQLAAIKLGAAARRQIREEKAAKEAEEIAEAIRLVEEFEREEALKAELLRQEQERIEEERRRRELEERIRREGSRRRLIAAKYEELRAIFSKLNPMQRIRVQQDHDEAEAKRIRDAETELTQMREKQEWERGFRRARADEKIAKRGTAYKEEFAARVAEERSLEEQYAEKLRSHYSGKRNGEEKAAKLLHDFKTKMDVGFADWKKITEDEIERYIYAVREDLAVGEEVLAEKERRAERAVEAGKGQAAVTRLAEMRWVEVVIAEREKMPVDMWVEEIDSGEDIEALFGDASDELAVVSYLSLGDDSSVAPA